MSSGYPSPVSSRSTVSSPSPRLGLTPSRSSSINTSPTSPSSSYACSSPGSPYPQSPAFSNYGDDNLLYSDYGSPTPYYLNPPPPPTSAPPRSSPTSIAPVHAHQYSGVTGYTALGQHAQPDNSEVWVTKDGKQVRYSSAHLSCATM